MIKKIEIPVEEYQKRRITYLKTLKEIPPGGRVYGKGWIDCLRYLVDNYDLEIAFNDGGKLEKIHSTKL